MTTVGFDLDGTIMRGAIPRGVMPRIIAHFESHANGTGLTADEIRARFHEENRRIYEERVRSGDLVAAYDWDEIWPISCAALGLPAPLPLTRLIAETAPLPGVCAPLDGAVETLGWLRAAGYRTIALTNGHAKHQEPALLATGLLPLLEAVFTPERVGTAKPDARFFEHASPEAGVHVGDTLAHDVLGANLAGWRSVWIEPKLPPDIAALAPWERTGHPGFATHLADSLAAEYWARAHPEAVPEAVLPWAVIVRLDELPALLADGHDGPAG